MRLIAHVDMDAFFASVEVLAHPEYSGLPLIVGADPRDGRGRRVVSTCSYEARALGVHSAMPISKAYQLAPGATYLPVDMERYAQASEEVMEAL
ncbi:MAG: DNA polymerase IV, partial [Thermoplasmata archaeon]|nr:DNA polymerase IV [Thermoplasmata archaeon]